MSVRGGRVLHGVTLVCGAILAVGPWGAAGSGADDGSAPRAVFDVCQYGAIGDGKQHETQAINQAVRACAAAGGGQVVFPPGRYRSGTVHLQSNVTLVFEAGAVLVGTSELAEYQHFSPPEGTPEARFRPQWHRALILGDGLENVAIVGGGVIDGNKVFDPHGEERMRGPHTILLGHCRQVTIRDISIRDSANYAVMLEHCQHVDVRNVRITGGWDAVHFRGWPDRPCHDVSIIGCQFFTGDDAIAGRYWKNVLIRDCVINSSCNGIRLIGPAEHLIIDDCLFYGPGVHEHRTSDRHNMLAGIILQPGAWDATQGHLDDVLISNITMRNVATAFQLVLKPGNTAGSVSVQRLSATGVYRAACSVESWTDEPVERVVFRDVRVEYAGGGTREQAEQPVRSPGVDARPLPAWGFFARNVNRLIFEDVRLGYVNEDLRPVMMCQDVRRLTLDGVRYPRSAGAAEPLVLKNVAEVKRH